MKRFKKFLTEAEVPNQSIPPGVEGTEQHGPPSPNPNIPENIPNIPWAPPPSRWKNEPDPRNFESWEQYWEAYLRWAQKYVGPRLFQYNTNQDYMRDWYKWAWERWTRPKHGRGPGPEVDDGDFWIEQG